LNPLVAAANPLLDVIPQLRASVEHPNPGALREKLIGAVRQFEARGRASGASSEQVVAARYALCTLIDETAANTPWGATGAWAQQGLLAFFHGETEGGDKFFQILSRLAENPQANVDVLQLMYVCLQFGLEGRYRIVGDGQRQLEAIRHRLLEIIRRQRGEYERDLSAKWQGVADVGQRRLGWLPVWVVGAVALLLLAAIYLGFRLMLSSASDPVARQIASIRLPSAAAPPAPVPKQAAVPARLSPFLADEIRRGLVRVDDRPDRSVAILGDGLFKPGEVVVSASDQWLLGRIADALASVPGQIDVVGHTDDRPIRSLRFPSNWELSKARAQSVAKLLGSRVAQDRMHVDGLGDTEPLVPNDTAENRARNRRVEITVHVPPGEAQQAATAPASRP
jgi:type VI secretion system protein ImpK